MVKNWRKMLLSLLLSVTYILPNGLSAMAEDLSERPLKDKYSQGSSQTSDDTVDDTPNYLNVLAEYQKRPRIIRGKSCPLGRSRSTRLLLILHSG